MIYRVSFHNFPTTHFTVILNYFAHINTMRVAPLLKMLQRYIIKTLIISWTPLEIYILSVGSVWNLVVWLISVFSIVFDFWFTFSRFYISSAISLLTLFSNWISTITQFVSIVKAIIISLIYPLNCNYGRLVCFNIATFSHHFIQPL